MPAALPSANRLVRGVLHGFTGILKILPCAMRGSAPGTYCYQQQRCEQTVDESFHA